MTGAPAHLRRLRRARCLVCYWRDDTFLAHAYPGAEPVTLPGHAVAVLAAFADWRTPAEVVAALPDREQTAVEETVEGLVAHGVLLAEGSQAARRDEDLATRWPAQAAFLHYTTLDHTPAVPDGPVAHPAPFTVYPAADRILLPRGPAGLTAPYEQVLHQRRTHYALRDTAVPLRSLATLLATVFGPVDFLDAGPAGVRYRRTSPCAGARQELEAYLAVRAVTDVAPGWYHYNVVEHSLELLAEGCDREELTELCLGQPHAGQAAFLVALVAVVERQLTHHDTARSYRVCLLDAGHLGQTFTLTATALGLGSFPLAAYRDTTLTIRLGLDEVTHVPLHLLGAGLPTDHPHPEITTAGLDAFRRTHLPR